MSEINGNSEKHLASIDGLQVCITPSITADQLERVDLQPFAADKTLSIHKFLKLSVQQAEFRASFQIIDLKQVYISADAKAALRRCYLTEAFLLDKFGAHYAKTLLTADAVFRLASTVAARTQWHGFQRLYGAGQSFRTVGV